LLDVTARWLTENGARAKAWLDKYPILGLTFAMRVIAKATLSEFWSKHPASQQALRTWYEDASHAQWRTPQDIKARYASASFVSANRVVFNIKGNDYRLVVAVAYRFSALYVKFVGTHAQYDAIDATIVETAP
jgi:mRNA interferase HigB